MKNLSTAIGAAALLFAATGAIAAAPADGSVASRLKRQGTVFAATTRFTIAGAEVTDNATGLIWRRCSEGQLLVGDACVGDAATFVWEDAIGDALSEVDATGVAWRLPNVKELASIVDRTRTAPCIDVATFPNTPAAIYWSSSPLTGGPKGFWAVNFGIGGVGNLSHNYLYATRLVRATGH